MFTVWIKQLAKATLDLIYPRVCVGCDDVLLGVERQLCVSCKQSLTRIQAPVCPVCGSPVQQENPLRKRCNHCPLRPVWFSQARAPLDYNDERVRRIVHAFKFEYLHTLADDLAPFIIEGYRQYFWNEPIDGILPVPLHKRRQRRREYNQASLLAMPLSDETGIPLDEGVVIRSRWTAPQSLLSGEKRLNNIRGAFSVADPARVKDRTILVIDDVVTTGSTVNELSRILMEHGAQRVLALSLARAYTTHTS